MTSDPASTELLMEAIQVATGKLEGSVKELTGNQAGQIRKTQRAVRFTAIGVVADLVLTILGFLLFMDNREHGRQIEQVQQKTSSEVLCPLYDLFLDSYSLQSAGAKADIVKYNEAFVTIEAGAATLGCAHRTKGRN